MNEKRMARGAAFAVAVVLYLAFIGTIIGIAVHFIVKFW